MVCLRPTDGLSQSNHHLLAGGCLRDPTDDPLDSIHPHLQLHVVSEARRPVVVCWPRHPWRLQRFRVAGASLATQLRRKRTEKQEALSQDVLKATTMTLVALKNKQTCSSTCETATTARVKRLERQTGPDWTRTGRRDRPSWVWRWCFVLCESVNISWAVQEKSVSRYSHVPAFALRKPVRLIRKPIPSNTAQTARIWGIKV